MPELLAIISTHTPRHLESVLAGVAAQSRRADRVVVTCDTDDSAITECAASAATRLELGITLVQRAFTGRSRSSQVRNNGVRALLATGGDRPGSVLVFLDGDCVPSRRAFESHEQLCRNRSLVIGFRHDLTEAQTEEFSLGALATGGEPMRIGVEQADAITKRARRYRRQVLLRRFGLAKAHKPKLLSANFAVHLADYIAVNGFDERYEGYGQEDDDLGRRLYRTGCRPVIALDETIAYHQYHPTRAPGAWHKSPNATLFKQGGPAFCERGLQRPVDQPAVLERRFRT